MAITFDNAGQTDYFAVSSMTHSLTVSGPSNQATFIITTCRHTAAGIVLPSSVTFGGHAAEFVMDREQLTTGLGEYLGVAVWVVKEQLIGTFDAVATFPGSVNQGAIHVVSLGGVNLAATVETTADDWDTGQVYARAFYETLTANAWVMAMVYSGATNVTVPGSWSTRTYQNIGSDVGSVITQGFATVQTAQTVDFTHTGAEAADSMTATISIVPASVNPDAMVANRKATTGFNHSNSAAVSFTHTPRGTPNFVVATVNFAAAGNSYTSYPTYGGVRMSRIATANDFSRWSEIWVLENPPTGPQTMSCQVGVQHTVRVTTFSNVNVSGIPFTILNQSARGAASSISQAVSSALGRTLLVNVAKNQAGVTLPGAGQTPVDPTYPDPFEDDGNGCGSYTAVMAGDTSVTVSATRGTGSAEFMALTVIELLANTFITGVRVDRVASSEGTTVDIEVGSTSDRSLEVVADCTPAPSSVTVNGTPMTLIQSDSGVGYYRYRLLNPATGTRTITVSGTSVMYSLIAVVLSNVDQTTPERDGVSLGGGGGTPWDVTVDSAVGDVVLSYSYTGTTATAPPIPTAPAILRTIVEEDPGAYWSALATWQGAAPTVTTQWSAPVFADRNVGSWSVRAAGEAPSGIRTVFKGIGRGIIR